MLFLKIVFTPFEVTNSMPEVASPNATFHATPMPESDVAIIPRDRLHAPQVTNAMPEVLVGETCDMSLARVNLPRVVPRVLTGSSTNQMLIQHKNARGACKLRKILSWMSQDEVQKISNVPLRRRVDYDDLMDKLECCAFKFGPSFLAQIFSLNFHCF